MTFFIHNPYERAWHTADCVDTAIGDLVVCREQHVALREQEYGNWDEIEESQYEKVDPIGYKSWKQHKDKGLSFYAQLSGGESPADVWGRIKGEAIPSIIRIVEQANITDVIVVSHGMTTRGFIAALLKPQIPLHDFYNELKNPPNSSVHYIEDLGPDRPENNSRIGIRVPLVARFKHHGILYDPNRDIDPSQGLYVPNTPVARYSANLQGKKSIPTPN